MKQRKGGFMKGLRKKTGNFYEQSYFYFLLKNILNEAQVQFLYMKWS